MNSVSGGSKAIKVCVFVVHGQGRSRRRGKETAKKEDGSKDCDWGCRRNSFNNGFPRL